MEGINTMVKAARDRWKEYNRHNGNIGDEIKMIQEIQILR